MRMDSKLEISLLYDFYKELLNHSQQQVVELYVNDDLSLAEVADILSISRQGVRDSLTRATKKLRDYESKLHLLSEYNRRNTAAQHITDCAEKIQRLSDEPQLAMLSREIIEEAETITEREEPHGI